MIVLVLQLAAQTPDLVNHKFVDRYWAPTWGTFPSEPVACALSGNC
jgi:hypothetical protein